MNDAKPLSVLFFGEPHSGYDGFFAKHLQKQAKTVVDMVTFFQGKSTMWQDHTRYFRNIFYLRESASQSLVKKISLLPNAFRKISALGQYDVCHVQSYSPVKALFLPLLRRRCRKIIISFWGSDVNKTSLFERWLQLWGLRFADTVTFQNDGLREIFFRRYRQQMRPTFRTIWLGLDLIDVVKEMQCKGIDRSEAKRLFGIDLETVCITCGTYSSRDQNHVAIIDGLEKRVSGFSREILLLVPLTYGDSEYRSEVVARLKASGLPHKIFDTFLPDETVAQLWLATDILVQVLIKDAFSGVTQECLSAGCVVITGSWLPYGLLKERGVRFLEVDNLAELGERIESAVNDLDRLRREVAGNPAIIRELSGWPSVIPRWLALYREGLMDTSRPAAGSRS